MGLISNVWHKAKHIGSSVVHSAEDVGSSVLHKAEDVGHDAYDFGRDAYKAVGHGADVVEQEAQDVEHKAEHLAHEATSGLSGSAVADVGSSEKEKEGGLWGTLETVGGVLADGVEIAGTAGSHLAHAMPLLSTAVHGGLGVEHSVKMWLDARSADNLGKQAGKPSQFPEFDGPNPSGDWRHAAAVKQQEAQDEGAEAKQQFAEMIPLFGTALGLGTHAAKLLWDHQVGGLNPNGTKGKGLFEE